MQSKARLRAAEAHGLISGRVCAGGPLGPETWLDEVLGDEHEADLAQCEVVLSALAEETLARLRSAEISFEPFLPGEEHSLRERIDALGSWCEGFLYGLGSGDSLDWSELSGDAREALADLTELSRVVEQPEEASSAERDYFELVEYLRIGVIIISEDLNHDGDATP